jgi:YesN/AraC family two-component response regulator
MVMPSTIQRIRPDFELIEAAIATDALDAVSNSAVDTVLIDFTIPGLDGLELGGQNSKNKPANAYCRCLRQYPGEDYFTGSGTQCRLYS